jgi:hypothetical protein
MGKGIRSYLTPRFEGVVCRTVSMSSVVGLQLPRRGKEHGRATEGARGEHDATAVADKKEPAIQLMMSWATSLLRHSRLARGAAASGERVGGVLVEDELGFGLGWGRPLNDLNKNENFISMAKGPAVCCPARSNNYTRSARVRNALRVV